MGTGKAKKQKPVKIQSNPPNKKSPSNNLSFFMNGSMVLTEQQQQPLW
jgi:hypothetical protein